MKIQAKNLFNPRRPEEKIRTHFCQWEGKHMHVCVALPDQQHLMLQQLFAFVSEPTERFKKGYNVSCQQIKLKLRILK